MKKNFFLLAGCLFFSTLLSAQIPEKQTNALTDLYHSTQGDQWVNNANWNIRGIECQWKGVSCNSEGTKVIGLRLKGNNLTGNIPASVEDLENLEHVDLSFNNIDSIPPQIGDLQEIKVLGLGFNNIEQIPTQIRKLETLEYLYLNHNKLSAIPSQIGRLTNLKFLNLNSNDIQAIPSNIGALENLTNLFLSDNQLIDIPTQVGRLRSLITLVVSNNQISSIPTQIGNLSNLEDLRLSTNKISDLPIQLFRLRKLKTLFLHQNEIEFIPTRIGNLENLERLNLSENKLTLLPVQIGKLSKLKDFYVSSNNITSLPIQIGKLLNLNVLFASNNQISEIPIQLNKLKKLKTLDLTNNEIKLIPPQIRNLESLENLYLSKNNLTALPPQISQLNNLKALTLRSNKIDSIPKQINQLENLQGLYLSQNRLTEIPVEIGELNVTNLDLSYNQLRTLPDEIRNLSSISSNDFNAQYNCLTVSSSFHDWLDEFHRGGLTQFVNTQFVPYQRPDNTTADCQPNYNIQISSGSSHTCMLLETGSVKCWGWNSYGNLGNGNNTSSNVPVDVLDIDNATSLSASNSTTCALLDNGMIKCWGRNYRNEGRYSDLYGLLGSGSSASFSNIPLVVSEIDNAVDVSVAMTHACAVLNTGIVKCWGSNFYGVLGNGNIQFPGGVANPVPQLPSAVLGINNAIDIETGRQNSCAILETGEVKCWGNNVVGTIGNGSMGEPILVPGLSVEGIVNATKLALSNQAACAVLSTGQIKCWGHKQSLGNGESVDHSPVPVSVIGIENAVDIVSSNNHGAFCARLDTGEVKCWGFTNMRGIINDTITNTNIPVSMRNVRGVLDISQGYFQGCLLFGPEQVKCWGYNFSGQLGNGSNVDSFYELVDVVFP